MRCRSLFCACAMCLALLLPAASGCLSLGGTTTHVHEDPRVDALETRVSALESILRGPHVSRPNEE
jgi:hypothetical protein